MKYLILILLSLCSYSIDLSGQTDAGNIFTRLPITGCIININITPNIPQYIEFLRHTLPFILNLIFE